MPATATPSLEDLERTLQDQAQISNLIRDGRFGEFVKNYADAKNAAHADVAQQVKDETQRVLAEWLKEQGAEAPRRLNFDPSQPIADARALKGLYNPRAPGAVLDKEFESAGHYFKAIWGMNQTPEAIAQRQKIVRVRNDMGTVVPADGGFLVPENLRAELLRVSLETSIVRPRARVIPMESARVPFPMIDSTSNVSSVHGGIVFYWTEEGAALTESQPKFGRVVLDAKKLTGYTEVPRELVQDSIISFQAFIDQVFPEAMSFAEDDAFLNGSGVGEPLGALNAAAAISVTKESGQAADTIVWENIIKAYSRMLPSSLGRAVWVASINTFPELATMALSVGTGGSAVWLNNGAEGPPMTILGRPVIFTEKAPVLGDAGDINFIDFGYYLIGDRQIMQAESSDHYRFGNDLVAYRIIQRVDGRPWLQSAITPANNGSTLSPFVKIAARA